MSDVKLCPMRKEAIKIPLPRGLFALVDKDDEQLATSCRWTYSRSNARVGYVRNQKAGYLHRLIMAAPSGMEVDHINGNTLDNRRNNLRLCTERQNRINHRLPKAGGTSKYYGVSWNQKRKKWMAFSAKENNPRARKNLGGFDSEIDAALAYDRQTRLIYGDFAKLNFPGHCAVLDLRKR